jgi:hypothetical protein
MAAYSGSTDEAYFAVAPPVLWTAVKDTLDGWSGKIRSCTDAALRLEHQTRRFGTATIMSVSVQPHAAGGSTLKIQARIGAMGGGLMESRTLEKAVATLIAEVGDRLTATAPATPTVPAAWLDDPTARHQHRYWDGFRWTGHVSDNGVTANDPL